MTENQRLLIYGGGAVAVLAGLWWLTRGPVIQNGSVSLPVAQNPAPITFPMGGVPSDVSTYANPSLQLSNPGSASLFPSGAPTGALTDGAGSADGATGPCNCPGSSDLAYGSMASLAAQLQPLADQVASWLPAGILAAPPASPGPAIGTTIDAWNSNYNALLNAGSIILGT